MQLLGCLLVALAVMIFVIAALVEAPIITAISFLLLGAALIWVRSSKGG